MPRYGASPEDWDRFIALGLLPDLLPVVSDPHVEPSPGSRLTQFAKTPSMINGNGCGHGLVKWTQRVTTAEDVARWSRDDRHGICVVARRLRALDVDVERAEASEAIRSAFAAVARSAAFPVRSRANSGKLLIPFWLDGELPKHVLPVEGGMVEVLGESQQFIAIGTHPSGERYAWSEGEIPALSREQFASLWQMLVAVFGTGEPRIAREKRSGAGGDGEGLDDVGQWLTSNWEIYDVDSGRVYIQCPFADEHTSEDNGTGTAYFSAGSGGYSQGHFRCLHAHCEGRGDEDFLDAVGYGISQFADLGGSGQSGDAERNDAVPATLEVAEPERCRLMLVRDGKGKIEPTADNLIKLISEPSWLGRRLVWDDFAAELVWCPSGEGEGEEQWRTFTDADVMAVRVALERIGVKPMGSAFLRECIGAAGVQRSIDTARVWLSRLAWDGVPRVEQFAVLGWGWEAGEYAAAVSRYVWTAMAGRVLEPGCQADMAPVLVGPQGAGKTRAIKAMAPSEGTYATIPLDAHDDNTARIIRGKLVGELEELRGLNSRAIEGIKAWLTRTHEKWIPKFKEYETGFARRLLLFGTTNDEEFLSDPTGERRFLPGRCHRMDVEWIRTWRDQLWAEGAALWMLGGIDWQGAEDLARGEHGQFKVTDAWEQPVARWLTEKQLDGSTPMQVGHIQITDALTGAVGVPSAQHDRARVIRMGKVLGTLGWKRERVYIEGERQWAWVYKGVVKQL